MDAVKEVLTSRIHRFQVFQRAGITTPRFTAQLESTINIYRETLKIESTDLRETIQNIHALMDALQAYWAKLFPDFDSATLLYSRMSLQRQFLERKLLEDYLENMPYIVSPELVWLARSQGNPADRERAAETLKIEFDGMDNFYHERVTSVLHEMMLDQDHVRCKLQTAAARDGQPGSDIQPLIDSCQWTALASALVKDRILVERLFVLPDEERTAKKIIHGIDRVQKKYFDNLTSPSRFVISARAGALSVKAAKEATRSPSLGAPPPYSDLADDDQTTGEQIKQEKHGYNGN